MENDEIAMLRQIMTKLIDDVIKNSNLTSVKKIELIIEAFTNPAMSFFLAAGGRYYYEDGDGHVSLAVNLPGSDDFTLLGAAANCGDLDVIKWLIEDQGADLNLANKHGFTPLLLTAEHGHVEVLLYLISKGVDVNRRSTKDDIDGFRMTESPQGTTALHEAVRYGQIEYARALLNQGAIFQKRSDQRNPLELCELFLQISPTIFEREGFGVGDGRYRETLPRHETLQQMFELLCNYYRSECYVRSMAVELHSVAALETRVGDEMYLFNQAKLIFLLVNNLGEPQISSDLAIRIMEFICGVELKSEPVLTNTRRMLKYFEQRLFWTRAAMTHSENPATNTAHTVLRNDVMTEMKQTLSR